MAARWVDLKGQRFWGLSEADDVRPEEFPNALTTASLTLGRPYPLGDEGRLMIATGATSVINANRNKVIRAFDMAAEVTVSMQAVLEYPTGSGPPSTWNWRLEQATPDVLYVELSAAALGGEPFVRGCPRSVVNNFISLNSYHRDHGESPGWTWQLPQRHYNVTPPMDWAGGDTPRANGYWTQRGVFVYTYPDSSVPLNFFGNSQLDLDNFAGAHVEFAPLQKGSGTVRSATLTGNYTRLAMLLDDQPTWQGEGPGQVGIGLVAEKLLELRLFYPSGEAVVGESIYVSTEGARADIRVAGTGTYRSYAEALTDSTGVAKFQVRGISGGTARFEIMSGRTDAAGANRGIFGQLYSPQLFGVLSVEVYGGDDTDPPEEEPDYPPPPPPPPPPDPPPPPEPPPVVVPGEEECTYYPAIPEVTGVPPRVVTTPVNGWTAGANSIIEIEGNARTVFSFESRVVGVAVGFVTYREDVVSYDRIACGVVVSQAANGAPEYRVIEYGVFRSPLRPYVLGQDFELRRAQGEVSLWTNGERVHVYRTTLHETLMVGCSMYASGDTF